MKTALPFVLAALAAAVPTSAQTDAYVPGPDSVRQARVPQGDLLIFDFTSTKIFPGTTRKVTVYVPDQYNPVKPACLFVDQDGVQWDAPTVLDNLIARGEVPVQIGVFVTPGVVPAANPDKALARYNRSLEYDGLGDAYARFIVEELLPQVQKYATPDRRAIRLSPSANDHAIAGSSSGAIAAFTAAWEHPEWFSRVLSSIGTFVGLRGGERYPTLIRKYEPKPIRVFLQDGSNDLNIYAGDWWMAAQTMERALTFAGYEVNHTWGDGGHTGKQMTSILPDALRFLWKDWPEAVQKGQSQNGALKALLVPGKDWELVGSGYSGIDAAASNKAGEVFFEDGTGGKGYRFAAEGALEDYAGVPTSAASLHFGPDGTLYAATGSKIIARKDDKDRVVSDGIPAHDLVVGSGGNVYFTASAGVGAPSDVWLLKPNGDKKIVDTGLARASGITLSPDQSLLYVADAATHWIYSYEVRPDGSLADKQRYFWLHTSDADDASGADSLCCDQEGWLYVATSLGIQVCDQAGRVNAILPTPTGIPTAVCFGGKDFATLYVTCGSDIYSRRLHAAGSNTWAAPTLPPKPHL